MITAPFFIFGCMLRLTMLCGKYNLDSYTILIKGEAMRNTAAMLLLLFGITMATPVMAEDALPPAAIAEKMAFKFTRGITNVVTCVAEIPKQTITTIRERGAVGYVIGPLKGIGMTVYRGLVGGVEAIFFLVPQPGYYDPMVEPEYVWQGWGEENIEKTATKAE